MRFFLILFVTLVFYGCATNGDYINRKLPSTHEPLEKIGNVHSLRSDNRILRGSTPEGKAQLLKDNGVTDVLIFRDGKSNFNEMEKAELRGLGYKDQQIHHIQMKWKKLPSFESGCRDVISALLVMRDVENDPKKKLYVHCTMGEDRTGLISGLYRMLFQGWSAEHAYQNEMCAYGFAESSPHKPTEVVNIVNEELKTLFAQMAVLIETKALTQTNLSTAACSSSVPSEKTKSFLESKCRAR